MNKIDLINSNKELFWDVSDILSLDNEAIEERFLKYWNWGNIKDMINIFWLENFKKIYIKLRDKKRTNLSKKTINFFNLYLNV